MDSERFEALIEAYGGRLERWPDADREAARAFARSSPEASRLLAEAERLDLALEAWVLPAPGAVLRDAIVRSAPGRRGADPSPRWRRLWWAGAGLAAAGVAGMAVGVNLDRAAWWPAPNADANVAFMASGDSLTVLGASLDTGKIS